MAQLSKKLIKKLKNNGDFNIFQEYIVDVINKLDSLNGFNTDKNNEGLGEEVRARVIAKNKLYEILRPFAIFKEKKLPSEEEIKKAKERVGL